MINTKLILIDGITGSGKSTTAQFLAKQLNENDIKVKWYHEDEYNHPLGYEEDVEVFLSQEESEKFMTTIPKLWQQFVDHASENNEVHIIESHLLQDTVRILFQNNLKEERIFNFVDEIEDIIKPLNPVLLYFHQEDAGHSIRKIWNRRGDEWKKWFVESDIQTPYVKSCGITGEAGVIKLWSDYQWFTNQLFDRYGFDKISIENSAGEWDDYYQRISSFLDIKIADTSRKLDVEERICGIYKETDGDLECTIKLLNGSLVCDLIWPDIRILPIDKNIRNKFYLESFPVFMEFVEDTNGCIKQIRLSGGREKLQGRVIDRVVY